MNDQATATFEQHLRGRLIRPTDADYEAVRALYNGMIDKRPRLIARCADVADVISAVNFAHEEARFSPSGAADTTAQVSGAATEGWLSTSRR